MGYKLFRFHGKVNCIDGAAFTYCQVGTYSGGNKRKLSVILAMMGSPKVRVSPLYPSVILLSMYLLLNTLYF